MHYLVKLFKGYQTCKDHNKQVFWVCYDPRCASNRFICKDQRCNRKHEGHTLNRYEEYKEILNPIEKHIRLRESVENNIKTYKQNAINALEKMFQEMEGHLFCILNTKYCSNRFLEIEKIYKQQGDYIPLIYQFKEHIPENIYKEIQTLINQKQKSVIKQITQMQVSIDTNAITAQKLQQYTFNQRQAKIKSILPFKCDLKLRFKASENQFLSKRLHAVNIRGPIILYVQSHKNKHFGGYSNIMFPKYQQQYGQQYRQINSFLFSLDHRQILPLKQQYKKYAIKGGINFGFGQGDLLISDQCNKGNISWCQIGRCYKEPSGVKGPLNWWLAGAAYFRVLEYQIYSVEGKRQK